MTMVIRIHGSDFLVEGSDQLKLDDAIVVTHPSQDHREFVKLAATIQEPRPRTGQLTFNFDRVLLDSMGTENRSRIVRPPGSRLRFLADFFLSRKTMERVINPVLTDLHNDYCEALAQGRPLKAFWARIRGYWSFWKALGFFALIKNIKEMSKISGLG